jgi:hypothetical protein
MALILGIAQASLLHDREDIGGVMQDDVEVALGAEPVGVIVRIRSDAVSDGALLMEPIRQT